MSDLKNLCIFSVFKLFLSRIKSVLIWIALTILFYCFANLFTVSLSVAVENSGFRIKILQFKFFIHFVFFSTRELGRMVGVERVWCRVWARCSSSTANLWFSGSGQRRTWLRGSGDSKEILLPDLSRRGRILERLDQLEHLLHGLYPCPAAELLRPCPLQRREILPRKGYNE